MIFKNSFCLQNVTKNKPSSYGQISQEILATQRLTNAIEIEVTAAKIENNFYRDGQAYPNALPTTSKVPIQPTPGKTTTVLGSYITDTKAIIEDQLGYPKSTNFGPKPGGFNILNTPESSITIPEEFWTKVNKPFLDAAISRGDEIYLATRPTRRTYA